MINFILIIKDMIILLIDFAVSYFNNRLYFFNLIEMLEI